MNDRVVTLHLPLDRGDLLARAHREGEVVDTSITDDSVVVRVLLDSVSVGALRRVASAGVSFTPPPYPYDRLDELKKLADVHEGGAIECSIGTPIDPPPDAVLAGVGEGHRRAGLSDVAGSRRPARRRRGMDATAIRRDRRDK